MRISRLHVPVPLSSGTSVQLDEENSHYLRTVLRLRKGFELTVFNGEGGEYAATVEQLGRDAVVLCIGEHRARTTECPLVTRLGLGISRGERMDFAIQKAVELGVSHITPLVTGHCVVRLDEDKKEHRLAHWTRIARSACEQSGRDRLPRIDAPEPIAAWVSRQTGLRLFMDPRGTHSLRTLPPPSGQVCLLSGPEGGFTGEERTLALDSGFTPIRLGPRILRTETAVLATLAAIQTLWGDWI